MKEAVVLHVTHQFSDGIFKGLALRAQALDGAKRTIGFVVVDMDGRLIQIRVLVECWLDITAVSLE